MLDGGESRRYLPANSSPGPMPSLRASSGIASLSLASLIHACAGGPAARAGAAPEAAAPVTGGARLLVTRSGFTAPEAVRYDREQDVYFVSNFGAGPSSATDDDGFISRMRPDGSVEQLRFIAGGANGVTLHAPRGMAITGDTLWVADADAVRGFHRRTGAPLASVSFAGMDAGFLNDVSPGPDGALYVTDTGRDRIYRIADGRAAVALADAALGRPNGITWDGRSDSMLVVPYGGRHDLLYWAPRGASLATVSGRTTGAAFDGVEFRADGSIVVASQADSSIHLITPEGGRASFKVAGRPADIAYDARRNRVAIPYIARNLVEIWELPAPR